MWQVGDEPVPGYRLQSFLGKGLNATVWRATGPGRTAAALKFINLGGKLGLKEFRGAQRVKDIRHAHLLPITALWLLDDQSHVLDDDALDSLDQRAHGRETGPPGTARPDVRWPKTLVVAMLLADKNLLEKLEEHRRAGREGIPVDELLDYMADAAKGIDFLNSPRHDLGEGPVAIQHCDIKPQNIVLVGNSAVVCDFGLARVLGGSANMRTISGRAGTPAYVPPECIRGVEPSHTSDQYSLAITYFELRTGKLPFGHKWLQDVFRAHSLGKLELGPLPDGERSVIRRATSLRPEDRFPSSLEMVRALRRAVEERHVLTATPAALQPGPGFSLPAMPSVVRNTDAVAPLSSEIDQSDVVDENSAVHDTNLVLMSCTESTEEIEPAAGGPGTDQAPACVIQFQPASAEVAVNGVRQDLDAEGRAEIQADPDTPLEILAAAPGYAEFHETLTVARLESLGCKVELRRDAGQLVDQGIAKLEQGDIDGAFADFDEAIDLAPDLAEAYFGRALAYGATADHRRDCADAFNEEAHSHFMQGNYERAIADFIEAARLNPDLASANRCRLIRNRALAYRKHGDYDKAIADYGEVIRAHPDLAKAYRDRALVYLAKGDYDKAVDDCASAMRLAPDDAEADYRQDYASACRDRGDAYYRDGEYDRALVDYDEAIRTKPDWAIAYNQRGRTYGAKGYWDKAIADYTKSIGLGGEFIYLYLCNRGRAYYNTKSYHDAIADFNAAIKHKPDYAQAYRWRGLTYEMIGMQSEAKADRDKARTLE